MINNNQGLACTQFFLHRFFLDLAIVLTPWLHVQVFLEMASNCKCYSIMLGVYKKISVMWWRKRTWSFCCWLSFKDKKSNRQVFDRCSEIWNFQSGPSRTEFVDQAQVRYSTVNAVQCYPCRGYCMCPITSNLVIVPPPLTCYLVSCFLQIIFLCHI